MPYIKIGRSRVNYGLMGEEGREVIVFINGLTQTNTLWTTHQEGLSRQGYRVLTYDTLGQGQSSKPVLGIRMDDHADLLLKLLDALEIKQCHLCGISFGGVVAMHVAMKYPERVKSLVPMSTFAEMPGQLEQLGRGFYMAITQAGFPLIQTLLLPMNVSSNWIEQVRNTLPESMRRGYLYNDPYAIQNLMESYVNFQPFAQDLNKIRCPTLILNGEFDYLTPRICHETLRQNIQSSRLMIVPHAFHAFTLEYPELTVRIIEAFVRNVLAGQWQGDKTVWVASEDAHSEVLATRSVGDHMRAVFVRLPEEDLSVADEWRVSLPGAEPVEAVQVKPARKPTAPKKPVAVAVKEVTTTKPAAKKIEKPVSAGKSIKKTVAEKPVKAPPKKPVNKLPRKG
ncbi:MAG: alpha/beta hydrolase [Proteobacteria bacterium]|nr:alpha/beta hydrolase [Pseudomonadota bacterium]